MSNALQIINVQTTGIQERLALTRLKNFGVSVDKYLVWGEPCIDWVKMNKLCRVNEFKIIEPPRCRLFKNKISKNNSVICFANSPEISAEGNRLTFLHNWIVVEEFIVAVLNLAENHSDIKFVLRFKNLNILKCNYFNELCKIINRSNNVVISDDYSRPGISYHLLSDALEASGTTLQ